MTQIVPITSDKCYICFEFTSERSPCKCKSHLHESPCLEKLIENHIQKYSIYSEVKIKCTICKKPYSQKVVKKIIKKVSENFLPNNINRFRKIFIVGIYSIDRRLFKILECILKIFTAALLFLVIYSAGILLNYSVNYANNTTITDYNKFSPYNFFYGFGVFVVFTFFVGCLKKCCFNENPICL